MSTGNFYYKNSSRIFAIGPSHDIDEDTNEEIIDEWWYDDAISNIKYEFKKIKEFTESNPNERVRDYNMSYPGSKLGNVKSTKWYKYKDTNIPAEVSIDVLVNSGYYEGACYDWGDPEYSVNDWFDQADDTDNIKHDLEYYYDVSEDDSLKLANELSIYFNSERERLVEIIEKVFEENSTPLKVTARFSNGETIYEKA